MRRLTAARSSSLFSRLSWLRLVAAAALLWWLGGVIASPQSLSYVFSQETNPTLDEVPADPLAPPPAAAPARGERPALKHRTFIDSIRAGGYIGVIIILMSIVAVGFVIEHALTIRKQRLMPDAVARPARRLDRPGRHRRQRRSIARSRRTIRLATDVVLAGLERFQSSEFGFADYKAAAEEAGEDNTARLYRKTDGLNVIGVIAPMLGLFGTVEGMMESFNIIASQRRAPPSRISWPTASARPWSPPGWA